MMHGIQKMQLTHASVHEALQDYLTKHMEVKVRLLRWAKDPNSPYGQEDVAIEFEQNMDEDSPVKQDSVPRTVSSTSVETLLADIEVRS